MVAQPHRRLCITRALGEHVAAIHQNVVIAYNVAARNANFQHEQLVFREEAAIEIETLTEGTDG